VPTRVLVGLALLLVIVGVRRLSRT
jgi:hypothetical protein